MGTLSKWNRENLEYHIVQLMCELYQSHRKFFDGESFRFTDILNELETEDGHLLKDLAREIWTREDCASDEEWAELKLRLGIAE